MASSRRRQQTRAWLAQALPAACRYCGMTVTRDEPWSTAHDGDQYAVAHRHCATSAAARIANEKKRERRRPTGYAPLVDD